MREQVAAEVAQLMAARRQLVHDGERVGRRGFCDGARHAREQFPARDAERRLHVRRFDLAAAETYHLIEGRLRVAHRALAGARHLAQRLVADLDLLGVGDEAQPLGYLRRGDGAELELLAARKDRLGHLVRVRRRHDEEDARRRLLQRLQKRVEGLGREHVDFVHDEDLIAVARRVDADGVDDRVADVVDAGFEAASISSTLMERPSATSRQDGQASASVVRQGVGVGRSDLWQLTALASSRAVVVFPTPRAPEKR